METLRAENEKILDLYLQTAYWQNDQHATELFSEDCVFEFPYAPPGMPKVFRPTQRPVIMDWFHRTVTNWSRQDVIKYPTKDLSRFWVESRTKAIVTWGGPVARDFDCAHMELVVIKNGKIDLVRTWSDPLAYYLAAGINLPVFYYDGKSGYKAQFAPGAPPPEPPVTKDAQTAKRQELFDLFLRAPSVDRDGPEAAHMFSTERKIHMPFMPWGMQRTFDEDFFASTIDWVKRTLVKWNRQLETFHQDEFIDEDVCIVETMGNYGIFQWDPNGRPAGYFQDYVLFIKLKDFQIIEFREYLDPINKLLTAGAQIPCFPFFY